MTRSHINSLPPEVIIYGGTGQAKVVCPIIEHYGSKVVAVFDDTPSLQSPFPDVKIYHGYKELLNWAKGRNHDQTGFCIAIGNPHGKVRLKLHDSLIRDGFKPITIAHPTSWIAGDATIDHGSQIMAGAVIMPEVRIGLQCIINTNASVDHECIIEDGSEDAGYWIYKCLQPSGVHFHVGERRSYGCSQRESREGDPSIQEEMGCVTEQTVRMSLER